jgi:hypothetical protein
MSRRSASRPAAIAAGLLSAVVLVVAGWWVRDQVVTSGGTWTPILGLLLGGAGGALIGAFGAWIVARENRAEAKRTRFHGDLRSVATEMHRAAELHMKQRRQQFASWQEVADKYDRDAEYVAPPGAIPRVDDMEPVYYAALAIAITASEPTIAAAWSLYRATRNLDLEGLSYIETEGDRVDRPSSVALRYLAPALDDYKVSALAFVNAVRLELEEDPLPALPDPDSL